MTTIINRLEKYRPALFFIAALWAVFILQHVLPITQYGIYPRSQIGLIGILTAPFIHANWQHILLNSLSFLLFFFIFNLLAGRRLFLLLVTIVLLQGVLTWLLARSGNHIGASGIIFGLFGYIAMIGFLKSRLKYLLISLLVLFVYGYLVLGVVTPMEFVSWESYLFGLLAGGLAARFMPLA